MEATEALLQDLRNRHPLAGAPFQTTMHDVITSVADIPVVLIVDDVANNLLAFEGMLRRDDIEIVTALSGRAALNILLERNVALAIVDVQMPDMDGFELASLMKGVEKTRYVPIIFVTADSRDQSRMFKGYDVGAVDYLYKPVDQKVLCGKVDVFVTLAMQRQQLIQAERMHEMFVGVLGHDLRNPLSGILMGAQALQRRTTDAVVGKTLEQIIAAGDRMSRMISQILDLTRVRLGSGLSLVSVPGDLRTIVEQVVEELATDKNDITVECVGDTRGSWDADRMAQVVSNLVGNAVEHSPSGSPVLIRVDGSHEEWLELEVHNGGAAVPSGLRDLLFEPFRGGQRTSGLGLGLFICKQIVTGHRGTIAFESSNESGTKFRVRLPRYAAWGETKVSADNAAVSDAETKTAAPEKGRERRDARSASDGGTHKQTRRQGDILVIDDDCAVRESLEILLGEDGYNILTAADGNEALELVTGSRVKPDVIIVDYNLAKGVTGDQVVAQLRQALEYEVPALLLTGDSLTGSIKNLEIGNGARLSKPMDADELIHTIERLRAIPRAAPAPLDQPSPPTFDMGVPPLIYVVDDDDSVRGGIRNLLEEAGGRVEEFASCEAFLDAFRPGHEACLLVDGYLPGMKGLQLLQHLQEAGHRLPAIMITGNGDVPMAVQAMRTGASDFLEKPVRRDDLLTSVARALDLSRDASKLPAWRKEAADRIASLTPRQRQIMEMVLAGHPNKNIAADLGLSQRTVEAHRAATMKKTGVSCLPELVKLALAAAWNSGNAPYLQLDRLPLPQRAANG